MNPFQQLAEAWRVARADRLEPEPQRERYATDPLWKVGDPGVALAMGALEAAIELIGEGETTNNAGPFVEMLIDPTKPPQNWCAAFVGFCYLRSATRQGFALPFKRSLGAKKLGENIAAVGRKFTDPREARPGDVAVWHRGVTGSWQGHIGLVESVSPRDVNAAGGAFCTVEGNAGPKVMRKVRNVREDRFAFFASLRR